MNRSNAIRLSAIISGIALSAAMCGQALAVPQDAYDQVVAERDALYQQLVDQGIEPCVQLSDAAAAAGEATQAGEGWQINHEWYYTDSLGWYHYYLCAIENTSDADWDIEANAVFYDAGGNIIGVGKQSENAVAPGYEILLSFSNEDEFDHATVEIKTKPSSYYSSVQADLDVSVSDLGGKAIIAVTNNGSAAAEFVEYNLLYMDAEGNVAYKDWGYVVDGDSEIKPGATEMRDSSTSAGYDHILAYVHGRK